MDILRKDVTMMINEKLKDLQKDIIFSVDDKLQVLKTIPKSTDLVQRFDFLKMKEHFTNYCDKVDRVTDTLFDGYKAEAGHILKSKVDRIEVEDMVSTKFDHSRGKE